MPYVCFMPIVELFYLLKMAFIINCTKIFYNLVPETYDTYLSKLHKFPAIITYNFDYNITLCLYKISNILKRFFIKPLLQFIYFTILRRPLHKVFLLLRSQLRDTNDFGHLTLSQFQFQ